LNLPQSPINKTETRQRRKLIGESHVFIIAFYPQAFEIQRVSRSCEKAGGAKGPSQNPETQINLFVGLRSNLWKENTAWHFLTL
jgi:hypothetical protein